MLRPLQVGLAALFAAALLIPPPALAQSDPESRAAAEVLFREGAAAFQSGDIATACPKLEAAIALTAGEALGGVLLLGQCYEKQGRTASAWGAYVEVAGKARVAGQTRRAEEADKAAAALLPRLHYLSLVVPAEITSLAGAQILRQGKPFRRELWTTRIPVDPGTLSFEVSAPGKRTLARSVQIPDSAGETKVTLEPLADEAPSAPPPPTAQPSTQPTTPPTAAPSPSLAPVLPPPGGEPTGMSGPRIAGLLVAVAGLAGMGAGVGMGAAAKGSYDAAVSDSTNCNPRPGGGIECADASKVNGARSLGDAGTAVFFVGAGAAVGGALLFLLAPAARRPAAHLPRVTVGRDGGLITWTGAF